jgi:hypothetical protein
MTTRACAVCTRAGFFLRSGIWYNNWYMATKRYKGSCHCGKVQFEVDIDLSRGNSKCNCTFCTKSRSWATFAKPADLHIVSGEDVLTSYKEKPETPASHTFCKYCGMRTFERGHLEQLGGDYIAIHLSSLDNVTIDEIMSGPTRYSDGRNNNWMNPPADVRNL